MELLGVLTYGGHTNFLHLFYHMVKSNRTICMHPYKTGEIWMLWVNCVNSDFLAVIEKYRFCQDVTIKRHWVKGPRTSLYIFFENYYWQIMIDGVGFLLIPISLQSFDIKPSYRSSYKRGTSICHPRC